MDYKSLVASFNINAFIKHKRALLNKFNQPIENVNVFPFRDLFSRVTVISPSKVVFHLIFIDHDIKKESYLEGKIPYIFRRGKKTLEFHLVV